MPPVTLRPAAGGVANGLTVATAVRNTGARAGDEVAELYLSFPDTPGAPRIALRGLQRLHLAAGESRPLTFTLRPRDLSAVTADGVREVMAGRFTVSVGGGQPGTGTVTRSASFTTDRVAVQPE